jgi:hypothetical protein
MISLSRHNHIKIKQSHETFYIFYLLFTNIHLLHDGEGNMKIYSPRGEYDTRGWITQVYPHPPELPFIDRKASETFWTHHLQATVTMWFLNIWDNVPIFTQEYHISRGEYDTRGWINFHISWTRMLWMLYYTEWNQENTYMLNTAGKHKFDWTIGKNQNTWSHRTKIIFREKNIIFHPFGNLGFPARVIVLRQEKWMLYYTEWNQENTYMLNTAGKHILSPLERCLRHLKTTFGKYDTLARGEYDTRGWINFHISLTSMQ